MRRRHAGRAQGAARDPARSAHAGGHGVVPAGRLPAGLARDGPGAGDRASARTEKSPARVAISGPAAADGCTRPSPRATATARRTSPSCPRRRRPPTSGPAPSTPRSRSSAGSRGRGRRGAPPVRRDERTPRTARARVEETLAALPRSGLRRRLRGHRRRRRAAEGDGRIPSLEDPAAGHHRDDRCWARSIPPSTSPRANANAARWRRRCRRRSRAPRLMTGKVVAVATLATLSGRAQPGVDVDHRAGRGELAAPGTAPRSRGRTPAPPRCW